MFKDKILSFFQPVIDKILTFFQPTIKKILSIYQAIANFIKTRFGQILSYGILIVVIVMTFVQQDKIVGWEPGYDILQPSHHGWVSSQGLAIISQATPENDFVGFAVRYKDEQNNIVYDYFDRYPVFFSAIFNRVLSFWPKLSMKIYLAKQVMNLIFVFTLLLAFLIIDKLIKNKPLALTAVLFAFSNPFLLFYKDMVHFDQPALLGFLLLTYAIALYKIDGLRYPVYIATFAAIAMGRGYASYAVLITWLAIEGILVLRTKGLAFGQKVKNILKQPSFVLLVLGIVWGAALLSYNIVIEAKTRNVSIMQTSIVDSASRRLSFNQDFNQEYENIINWPNFIKTEVNRIIQWTYPVNRVNLGFWGNALLLVVMFVIMGSIIRKQSLKIRMLFLILMLSGFVWLIPLRNLTAFHDYTTMFYIGIPLVFFVSVIFLLKPSREASYYMAIIGMLLYLSAIIQVKDLHESIAGNANQYTYDFMRIEEAIDGVGNNVYLADKVPYGPYAPYFYLSDQYLAPEDLADYVITSNPNYSSDNLTPNNGDLFLFKK